MTPTLNDDTKPHKKTQHRKETEEIPEKGRKGEDKEERDGTVNDPEKETRKKGKKKKKHSSDTQKDGAAFPGEDAVVSKREKKKRKRDIEINDEEADAKTSPKKKRKKTQRSHDDESIDLKKKSKTAEGDNEETPQTTKPLKKSKKSRKNKTGFFDPDQDEETDLPEQARKALSYAFCRFHNPDSWKFNKARQNWLVRNLWNFQSLPEKYEDLVVKYLSAVQGNTRENILKACQKTLDQSNANGVSDTSVPTGGPIITTHTPSDSDDQRLARARALLKALAPDSAS